MNNADAGIDVTGHAYVTGTYHLSQNCGHELDRYQLRIVYPDNFPARNGHPSVYLESHHDQWNPTLDSHIEDDWRLCLFVAIESGLNFERPGELRELFSRIHVFMLLQRIYQEELHLKGQALWPGPQRAHGPTGLRDALKGRETPLHHNDGCVCGSGRKYRKCCRDKVEKERAQAQRRNRRTAR